MDKEWSPALPGFHDSCGCWRHLTDRCRLGDNLVSIQEATTFKDFLFGYVNLTPKRPLAMRNDSRYTPVNNLMKAKDSYLFAFIKSCPFFNAILPRS